MADAEWGDLESYFGDAIAFIEWPEAGAGFLPRARAAVGLRHLGDTHRLIVVASSEKALENSVLAGVGPRV
jgi:tRNA A37 threonylcarbamoyladenosine biosynthesis protein TsaE